MQQQQVLMLPTEALFPDVSQPRRTFPEEDEERIGASIAVHGVLQPIRVRQTDHGWIIVSGEFRWRGAKRAGLATVPCLAVAGDLPESTVLEEQIVENVARNALRSLELARAVAKLKRLTGRNSQTLAQSLGLSGASITRLESLLTLPEPIQQLVASGKVSESAGYEISRLPDEASQFELAHAIAAGKLSRDQVADAVRSRIGKRNVKPKAARLPLRLDGGISITVSAGQPLTWDEFNSAIDRVRKEAKRLYEGGKEITELARVLKAS